MTTTTNGAVGIKIPPRSELLVALRERDGEMCQFPGCEQPLDFTPGLEGPLEVTIDHWMPQYFGKQNGWTPAQIWDLDNLKLMHKKCNAKKGDRIPNEDGTLPPRKESSFRYRRQKRSERRDPCEACDNGHYLDYDEICRECGGPPQEFPKWRRIGHGEKCDHSDYWCIWCSIGVIERDPVAQILIRGPRDADDEQ